MEPRSASSILHTLRGRVWLAIAALAAGNFVCGLAIYLVFSLLTPSTFYSILLTYLLSAIGLLAMGKWMVGEVLKPIDKLSMLAQTLERSPAASLPRTTGTAETDELLFTLQRNGRQVHNLIAMMDDVAAGKTERALAPLESNDRLSSSFQKLVAKVTDSVNAKAELIALQTAIARLAAEISSVRSGNLSIRFTAEAGDLKIIADAFRDLSRRLSESAMRSSSEADELTLLGSRLQNVIRVVADDERSKTAVHDRLACSISELRSRIAGLRDQVSLLSASAARMLDTGDEAPGQLGDSAGAAREAAVESQRQLQKLRAAALPLTHALKIAEELSKRAKIVALNASLQAGTPNPASFADEITQLSVKAENVTKMLCESDEGLARCFSEADETLKLLDEKLVTVAGSAYTEGEWAAEVRRLLSAVTQLHDQFTEPVGPTEHEEQTTDPKVTPESLRETLAGAEKDIARLLRLGDQLARSSVGLTVAGTVLNTRALPADNPSSDMSADLQNDSYLA